MKHLFAHRFHERNFLLCFTVLLFVVTACGRANIYDGTAPESTYERAQLEMEAGSSNPEHFARAQRLLDKLLAKQPKHYKARSLLGACYAAQGGFSVMKLIEKGGTELLSGALSGGSSSPMANLEKFIPEHVELPFMEKATLELGASNIPRTDEAMTLEIKTQASIFSTVYIYLFLKYLQSDPSAVENLTLEQAVNFAAILADTTGLLSGASNPISKVLASAVGTLNDGFAAVPGQDSREKLQNFIAVLQ